MGFSSMPMSEVKITSKGPNSQSSTNTPLPHIAKNLLIYLRGAFQDRVPTPSMTDREVWMEVGKISVVRHLEDIYKQQNETE